VQARRFAQVFGTVYVVVGLLGFVVTGLNSFAATSGDKLLLFGVNPLHNLVHVAVGAVWLLAARRESTARAASALIGATYLLVGILGLFLSGTTSALNLLNLNQPDNLLHFATALAALYFGLSARRTPQQPEGANPPASTSTS
jgi:hypothetical protein